MAADKAQTTRIGWIGTGVMGRWMCQHLMQSGYPAVVHTRSQAKAQPLLETGADWAASPEDVARASDVVFTMVGFPQDVREVYLGGQGLLKGARSGQILVDMTTTEPSLAVEIHKEAAALNVSAVDAPVSGGDIGAREARLSIMVGGEKATVDELMPFFKIMGRQIVHQGPAGSGQHTKMCNQIVIAGTMIGVCESLLYGQRAGLDLNTMLESIAGGAAGCWSLDNLAPRILKRDFDPGFFVAHFIKDMGIALEEAKRMQLCLPGLALVHQLYLAVAANGGARFGTQALMLALEKLNGENR
ncbi:MAG: NAD(P)-dependent oxidoreductase [Desulfobacterales bacterium]|nr:NAD(P)-dependent oxidoreductase [Desulfobacterales bacterium]